MINKKLWKRSKSTTQLVHAIRRTLNEAGYEEEMATTPLASVISVIARTGEEYFNVRLNKKTLQIVETYKLTYDISKGNVRRVFREKIAW